MSVHFVNNPTELFNIGSSGHEIRSVLMLCDVGPPSYKAINAITKWLNETPDAPSKYACFAGKFSEMAHDACDDALLASARFALTTWHVDEPIEDTAFFFVKLCAFLRGLICKLLLDKPRTHMRKNS